MCHHIISVNAWKKKIGSNFRYNHHAIPNGELVRVSDPTTPVFQFTQADLNNRQILFRHLGVNFGRIMLWVSDGQYFVSTDLRVKASPPFINIVNNSGLIIQQVCTMYYLTARGKNKQTMQCNRHSIHQKRSAHYKRERSLGNRGTSSPLQFSYTSSVVVAPTTAI